MKMKRSILLLLAVLLRWFSISAATVVADYRVVPLPQEINIAGDGQFVLNGQTAIVYPMGDNLLQRDALFLHNYLQENLGLALPLTTARTANAITLRLNKKIQNEEGYVLTVGKKGVAIEGSTAKGIFYGVQTLRKAIPAGSTDRVLLPYGTVKDEPRFVYRGMHLDCCRHFFSLDFVKKYIDLLALHNMNVFHWHLTDDQGWRIEIRKYPRLTDVGSYRSESVIGRNSGIYDGTPVSGYYTQEQAREIVKYAADRFITVIPEIEMPGHAVAALAAYPELGCTGGPYKVLGDWGIFDDVLCIGNEKIYSFCEDVLGEIIDIFPSKLIHIGGDETPTTRWESCPKCQARMKQEGIDVKHLQGYFTGRIEKFVNNRGRRILGWDEIMGGDITRSAAVMSWNGSAPGIKAAQRGHDVVMAPSPECYFDYYQTKDTYNEPLLIGNCVPVERVYNLQPIPDTLDPSLRQHILGVQANLWTEYITHTRLAEYQVLPRMAALAEVQWCEGKKDFGAFKERLTRLSHLYDFYHLVYAKHIWKEVKKD
jgi:hexosaminidase